MNDTPKPYTVEAYESLLKGIVLGCKLALWPAITCAIIYGLFAFANWASNPGQWENEVRSLMAIFCAGAVFISALVTWPAHLKND